VTVAAQPDSPGLPDASRTVQHVAVRTQGWAVGGVTAGVASSFGGIHHARHDRRSELGKSRGKVVVPPCFT
jgi:hypothetical protein